MELPITSQLAIACAPSRGSGFVCASWRCGRVDAAALRNRQLDDRSFKEIV